MSTLKQKRVAKLIVDNFSSKLKMTGQKLLENAGYGKGVAKSPKRVLNSIGVKDELKDYGFDMETAKKEVGKILTNGKEENRLRAATEVFKVTGAYAPEEKSVKHELTQELLDRIIKD